MTALTDAQLEALATQYDRGVTEADLDGAAWEFGPGEWLLDIDWDAVRAAAEREGKSPEALMVAAVNEYVHRAA